MQNVEWSDSPLVARPQIDLLIVILNYNTRDLLRNCLRSVLGSSDSLHKTICVVDNASSDQSAEMVRIEFPSVCLLANQRNSGFSAGNNDGLRTFGFGKLPTDTQNTSNPLPRYVLLLNPDTLVKPDTFAQMVAFMDANPKIGVAGPCVRRPDGSLDSACRRSFPTPQVSLYRMIGLSKLFPKSKHFNAYNLEYLPEEGVYPVDSVVGAYMQVRREAILQAGLLDEAFFMYGEDLDWAKRFKDCGWEVWYNGAVEMIHVKEAASSQSSRSRIYFYEAMWIFYRKHYQSTTPAWLDRIIALGIASKGALDVAKSLWRFCQSRPSNAT